MEKEFITIFDKYWKDFLNFLPSLVFAALILFLAFYIGNKISKLAARRILFRLDDRLLANFISRISQWIIVLIGFIVSMEILGLAQIAGGLIAGAGVSAIIIGFAFRDIGENFLSGMILAFNRPFKIGDVIVSEGITGTIISLDLRTTTIKTFEGYDVFIPNSVIVNNPLINYNREGNRRFDFTVGIDYEADVEKARSLIMGVFAKVDEILKDPSPFVIVSELTSNSTNLKIFYWVNALTTNRNLLQVKSEVIELTVKAFKEGNVNIPYDSLQLQFGKGFPEIPVKILNENSK
ncbi:MAG: mechanosensitive ion channel family protein [bacterium]|nr:mechanosensitive ion channel family protein [bacterium]